MTITYEYGKNLYVNLTNRCPNRCDFCLRTHSSGSIYAGDLWLEREPTKEEILEDIKKRDLSQYQQLVFCGYGEPTCRLEDILWLCDRVKEFSPIDMRLNTNGLSDRINGRHTAPELDGRFEVVSVSLNAPNAEKYEALCHSEYGLEAFPAILRFTAEAGLYVPKVYMTVVDTMPQEDIAQCRRLCEDIGAIFRVRKYIPN